MGQECLPKFPDVVDDFRRCLGKLEETKLAVRYEGFRHNRENASAQRVAPVNQDGVLKKFFSECRRNGDQGFREIELGNGEISRELMADGRRAARESDPLTVEPERAGRKTFTADAD